MKNIILLILLLLLNVHATFWMMYEAKDVFFWKVKVIGEQKYIHQFIRYENISINEINSNNYIKSNIQWIDVSKNQALKSGDIVIFYEWLDFYPHNLTIFDCDKNIYENIKDTIFMDPSGGLYNKDKKLKNMYCDDITKRFLKQNSFSGINYFWYTSWLDQEKSLEEQFNYYQKNTMYLQKLFFWLLIIFLLQNMYLIYKKRRS